MKILKDYNSEYIEIVDELVMEFINEINETNSSLTKIDAIDLSKSLINVLWGNIYEKNRSFYNEYRSNGKDKCFLKEMIWGMDIFPILPKKDDLSIVNISTVNKLFNFGELLSLSDNFCFFCLNMRQLEFLKSILEKFTEPVVVFVDFDTDNITLKNELVTIIDYQGIKPSLNYFNSYLNRQFPFLDWFINLFIDMFKVIRPKCIILIEGNHPQMEVLSSLSKYFKFPSICLQQGWPSVIHSRFKNMTYQYYFVWGEIFKNLFSKWNPLPQFIPTGYHLGQDLTDTKKYVITFFLQGPFVILNQDRFSELLQFVYDCSFIFPDMNIWIKEHPEYQIAKHIKDKFKKKNNIYFFEKESLIDVFNQTLISVSVFSSTIMESLAYNTIPFVINLSSVKYNPSDLEDEGLGIIVNNLDEAKIKLVNLVHSTKLREKILRNIRVKKKFYFENQCSESVELFVRTLNRLV